MLRIDDDHSSGRPSPSPSPSPVPLMSKKRGLVIADVCSVVKNSCNSLQDRAGDEFPLRYVLCEVRSQQIRRRMSVRHPEAVVMRFPRELHASVTSHKSHESHEE